MCQKKLFSSSNDIDANNDLNIIIVDESNLNMNNGSFENPNGDNSVDNGINRQYYHIMN